MQVPTTAENGVALTSPERPVPMRFLLQILLALLAAGLLALAFPRTNLSPLAFVGLAPLLWATRRAGLLRAAGLGLLCGTVLFAVNLSWLTYAMSVYGGIPRAGAFALLLVLAIYLGAYVGVFTLLWAWIAPRSSAGQVLLPPVIWTALEFLRTYALTGFPWGFLAFTQARNLPLIQVSAWTGAYGVSWLLVLSSSAVAASLERRLPVLRRIATLVVPAAVIAIVWLLGAQRLGTPEVGRPIKVALLQGNIPQDMKWRPDSRELILERYERLTRAAGRDGPALIVWPEAALPYLLTRDAPIQERVNALARETRAGLLIGGIDAREGSPTSYFNSAFHVDPERGVIRKYDKMHLVPFGEYLPLRPVLGRIVDKLTRGAGADFQAGSEYTIFDLDGARFGATISYEVYFPAQVRQFVAKGADFIVNITNDAWYGPSSAPYQHLAMAVFRAVENNVYLVRAANTGISAVVQPTGRVVAATLPFEERVLAGQVRPGGTRTFYTRHGDLFAALSLLATLLALAMRVARAVILKKRAGTAA